MGEGFGGAGQIIGDHREAMREGFGNYVRQAVTVALFIHDAGVPEEIGPAVFLLDFDGRQRAAEHHVIPQSRPVNLELQCRVQRSVAHHPGLERNAP